MKKIFIFSNANGYGGAERSIEDIITLFKDEYRIVVFASNKKHIENLKKISNIRIITLNNGNSLFITVNNLKKIFQIIKKENKLKLLINTNKGAFYFSILSYFLKPSFNLFIYIRDFQWKYQKFIFYALKKYNPTYLFTSMSFFDYKSFFSKNIKNYKIIPNFINTSDNLDSKKELTNDIHDEKIILIPAMINRWKGIEYAIKSLSLIKEEVFKYNIKLYIIGKVVDKEYFNELKSLVKESSLSNIVIFTDYTDNIEEYYKKSWIVLNTSISQYGGPETFGRTILESWKHKKPVIAFNCGGPKYIIKDGENGFLVEEKNINKLSQQILHLLNSKIYLTISIKGLETLTNEYSNKSIEFLLRDILN
jgi:glycosyltransferase involved in cell wall biosynthesis